MSACFNTTTKLCAALGSALIVATVVAGSTPEQQNYKVRIELGQRVKMRDGIELAVDIYRPDADGKFPVILTRTPYGRQGPAKTATHFAQEGYVYISMDVRGRGDSGGEFVPWRNEGVDGYDSVEWSARQTWSNGAVGTTGLSYAAYDQWLAAVLRPPHLAAMFLHSPMSDPFGDIWLSGPGGLPTPMQIGWFYRTSERVRPDMTAIDWGKLYWRVPMYTLDEATGRSMTSWKQVIEHSQMSDWWTPTRYQNQYERVSVPTLNLSGWYDDTLLATPENFAGMTNGRSDDVRKKQKMVIGPWPHTNRLTSKLGQIDFGASAQVDEESLELRWFDRWLKGIDNGIDKEPPARLFVMGENKWHDEHEWPIKRTRWTKFYLHGKGSANSISGDGTLSDSSPASEPVDKFEYDPQNPVPFITDANFSQVGGPDDYRTVENREDILVYTSAPLTDDTIICGPITAQIFAASSAVDTDFMAKLLDVWPSGYAQRLNDGMVRARFRDGMDRPPTPIKPGQVYSYNINLWYTCQMVAKGHRIRLEISSSAFPKFDRNPNTGDPLGKTDRWLKANQTVFHDRNHQSFVLLPILPRE